MLARVATRVAARQLPPALFVRQKTTTGIVGLEVVPDAKPVLLGLYAKTLSMLEGVPAEAQYRKVVTDYTKARMAVLKSTDDIPTIESKIGGGQVEQLIEQAKDELSLIPKLIAAHAFDPYNGSPAEDILTDLKRRGVALQRYDIPMRPSQDYPVETAIELELPAVPEPPKKA